MAVRRPHSLASVPTASPLSRQVQGTWGRNTQTQQTQGRRPRSPGPATSSGQLRGGEHCVRPGLPWERLLGGAGGWGRGPGPGGQCGLDAWGRAPEDVPAAWEAGRGLNCGQEISTVWAPGPGLVGAFLIPGLVGVVGPWRSTAATTSDLLTVSRGAGASCQGPQAGLGPRASATTDAPAASCSPMGRLRPQIREGRPAALEPRVRTGSFPPVPAPRTGGADPLGKPTCGASPGAGAGARLRGCPVGRGQAGQFDQWFRLMPGCWDRGQWPNRPRRMLPGPRQECHSSWAWLPRARPGLQGEEREAGGCPGASAAFPGPRGQGHLRGHGSQNPPDTAGWTPRPAGVRREGRPHRGKQMGPGTPGWGPPPPGSPFSREEPPPAPSQLSSRPWPDPQPGPAVREPQLSSSPASGPRWAGQAQRHLKV